jgi:type IV pilus assembly protein PilM
VLKLPKISLGRSYSPLIGLDITTSSIKLIELSQSGGQYRVEAYAAEPTPHNAINEKAIVDAAAVGDTIRRAVKRSGVRSRECAVAISGDAAITKAVQMPKNLSDAELEQQIEMQADQYIPFPMEEVSYDFQVLGPSEKDPEMREVLLVASRSENVEQRVAAVNASGLIAKLVDVEAFALENACKLLTHQMPDGGVDRTVAVVDFGASTTTFSVLKNLVVVYTRDFAFGGQQLTEEIMRTYGLSMEEAGRAKKEGGLPSNYQPEVLDPFIDDMTVLPGVGQRPQPAGADPDLRRLREHPGRGRRHREPGRHPRGARRPARADEGLLESQGTGSDAGRDGAAARVWSGTAEFRRRCQVLTCSPGGKHSASGVGKSS